MLNKILLFLLGPVLALFFVGTSFGYFMGTHTKYCPWPHMIADMAVCIVLDRTEEKILIQHADLDTNIYYLEVKKRNSSTLYEFPSFIAKIGSGDYSAKLIPENNEQVLINDSVFQLIELKD